jgi:solute carrier family 45 protein 1/2/4
MPYNMLITMRYTGAISDSSPSAYRRRYWIWAATIALSIATVTLAYVEPISSLLVTLFSNLEDWNPDRRRLVCQWCT